MSFSKKSLPLIFLFLTFLSHKLNAQDNPIQLRAAIHLNSTVSDGEYTLTQITQTAQDTGISVVIFTDRDLMRWEYGLWPLRNIVKKRVERNSVFTYGLNRYLKEIESLQDKFSDMVLIPGVESAPFYYWQGSFISCISNYLYQKDKLAYRLLSGRKKSLLNLAPLCMRNWHIHILAIGLKEYGDYKNLPVVGNTQALRDKFSIYMLWPILAFILGLRVVKNNLYCYATSPRRWHWKVCSKGRFIFGVVITLVGILFTINNWPFFRSKFDQYHSGPKDLPLPYQNYIDYVNRLEGLTFWSHPEAENIGELDNIMFETQKHSRLLLDTKDYTGFNFFPEGSREIGSVGGMWDMILGAYCQGLRSKPIWAIGGLGFERGDLKRSMENMQTVILVYEKNKQAVLKAMKEGKMYIVTGKDSLDFLLEEFCISDESGQVKGYMGDSVNIEGRTLLLIRGDFLKYRKDIELKIIKNGDIIKTFTVQTPFRIIYLDEEIVQNKSYYRIEITGKDVYLVTNPIFVSRKVYR
ncbi:MAG: hypothetical protein NC908_00755 [Candidatus Omnitrophica bacterium]|nr:hypothetical protein [Candidatus Omnitrophota bacterium]